MKLQLFEYLINTYNMIYTNGYYLLFFFNFHNKIIYARIKQMVVRRNRSGF